MNIVMRELYNQEDLDREYIDLPEAICSFENDFESDCSRLLHSPSFRRLQGKTQLFPGGESDFFRNRLTHSFEVEQIAQLIVNKFRVSIDFALKINPHVIRFACLAHDLGHPPFGHMGEEALNECMKNYGGFEGNAQTLHILTKVEKGIINFSGIEENYYRSGINATYRCLASVIKYNNEIPLVNESGRVIKGYYKSESDLVKRIQKCLGVQNPSEFKSIECQIMDIADDISNSVHDLEDSLKGKFLNPVELFFPNKEMQEKLCSEIFKLFAIKDINGKWILNDDARKLEVQIRASSIIDRRSDPFFNLEEKMVSRKVIYYALNEIFKETTLLINKKTTDDFISIMSDLYRNSVKLSSDGFARTIFVRSLTNKFIGGISLGPPNENCALQDIKVDPTINLQIQVLKLFHRFYQHKSTSSEVSAYRGMFLVKQIFLTILDNPQLMPNDFFKLFEKSNESIIKILDSLSELSCDDGSISISSFSYLDNVITKTLKDFQENSETFSTLEKLINLNIARRRCVCDFIAGMTDSYCAEFYGRLFSEKPQSYYKPI